MPRVEEEAIGWIIRLRDATSADWESFTLWLEADVRHAPAYERLATIDADAADRMFQHTAAAPTRIDVREAPPVQESARYRPQSYRRRWLGGIAAGVAVATGATMLLTSAPATYAVATAPGQTRSIVLREGTRIVLDGDTKLLLDRRDPRMAELASGEALFTVTHNVRHPFELRVGGARVEDLGTVFDVRRRAAATEVSVASGAVLYNPDSDALRLGAGDRLRDPDGPAPPTRSHVALADVAGWRDARLSFDDRSLAEVAAEIRATTGVPLQVSPAIAERRFTGVIVVAGSRDALPHKLEALLDVKAVRRGAVWLLLPAGAGR